MKDPLDFAMTDLLVKALREWTRVCKLHALHDHSGRGIMDPDNREPCWDDVANALENGEKVLAVFDAAIRGHRE